MAIEKYKIYCNTEMADKFWYLNQSDPSPTTCPTNTAHSVDLSSVVVTQIGGPQEVVQVLGQDTLSLLPYGGFFTAGANQITTYDVVLPQTMTLRGGVLYAENSAMGDFISLDVIDKDDVLGMGATPQNPIIIGQYVLKWFVMPNCPNVLEDVTISESLPQGLYVRIIYNSVGSSPVPVIINFLSYTGTIQ